MPAADICCRMFLGGVRPVEADLGTTLERTPVSLTTMRAELVQGGSSWRPVHKVAPYGTDAPATELMAGKLPKVRRLRREDRLAVPKDVPSGANSREKVSLLGMDQCGVRQARTDLRHPSSHIGIENAHVVYGRMRRADVLPAYARSQRYPCVARQASWMNAACQFSRHWSVLLPMMTLPRYADALQITLQVGETDGAIFVRRRRIIEAHEHFLVPKFEGVVAMQPRNFVREVQLVLRPAGAILPTIAQAGAAAGQKYRRYSGTSNPVRRSRLPC